MFITDLSREMILKYLRPTDIYCQCSYPELLYIQGELTDRPNLFGRRISGDIPWVEIQSAKIAMKQRKSKQRKFGIFLVIM